VGNSSADRRTTAPRPVHRRLLAVRLSCALAVTGAMLCALCSSAEGVTSEDSTSFEVKAGTLSFSSAPAIPKLSPVTVNGSAQTTHTEMTNFAVADATGSGAGWRVTVNGLSGVGDSPVFKQYCPEAKCGGDSGPAYVSGGAELAAKSLTLNSTSAKFNPSAEGPSFTCSSGCFVDNGSAEKIVSAAEKHGMGTFTTEAWGANSLALATPSSLGVLPEKEVYRVNLVWTLLSGP
jgi:WxL domain surface cell wall-binding